MEKLKYEIIPYSKTYEASLLALEKEASQGKFVQLEMIRDCFKTRSSTFDKSQIFLAIDMDGKLLGVLAAAIVELVINGKKNNVGYYYDIRVKKEWQGFGINTSMAKYAYKYFYMPNDVSYLFTTIKDSNKSAFKSASNVGFKMFKYSFLYLTIPTQIRLKKTKIKPIIEELAITCSSSNNKLNTYLQPINNDLKIWKTNLIYRLKLIRINSLLIFLNKCSFIFSKTYMEIPKVGDYLNCSTLIYKKTPTTEEINSILSILQNQQIDYLLVVCKRKAQIFKLLRGYSIHSYKYNLYSTFSINQNDSIELDVRCL